MKVPAPLSCVGETWTPLEAKWHWTLAFVVPLNPETATSCTEPSEVKLSALGVAIGEA